MATDPASGGSGGKGGAGGSTCDEYLPEPDITTSITVRLVNQTAAPLFFGDPDAGCSDEKPFTLSDEKGDELAWRSTDICADFCDSLMEHDCLCAYVCAAPFVWMIAPAGAYEVPWSGTVVTTKSMPSACFAEPACGTDCLVEERPPPGSLTLSASAWDGATCDGPCTCTPDESGSCVVEGVGTVSGTELVAATTITTVSPGTIELTFQ